MALLDGNHAVIWGVANRASIGWAIAQALHREGATLALTYESDRVESRVQELVDQIPGTLMLKADVQKDGEIESVYDRIKSEWGHLDTVVHSIAYAPKEEMVGAFIDTSRQGFNTTLDISAYSLIGITRPAVSLMPEGGSVMAMTYIASRRVFPSYNVMGIAKSALESIVRYLASDLGPQNIRVNAISAGPISTLAAKGVPGFTRFKQAYTERAPLGRSTDPAEVGDTAVYLASHLSRGVTGDVLYVDEGYHVVGF
ncbi:MAG TPA: enoyl-ACP reductase [Chloroflexota bacterium]|nr:enoyl-ACP reductase [Chloroflexota bacterium]